MNDYNYFLFHDLFKNVRLKIKEEEKTRITFNDKELKKKDKK